MLPLSPTTPALGASVLAFVDTRVEHLRDMLRMGLADRLNPAKCRGGAQYRAWVLVTLACSQ